MFRLSGLGLTDFRIASGALGSIGLALKCMGYV